MKNAWLIICAPVALATFPATESAQAATASSLVCGSVRGGYQYCPADTSRGVQLIRQLSNSQCRQGQSWGYDRSGVWVTYGCAAYFSVGPGGGVSRGAPGRPGSDVGAALVGGVVGALLGAAISGGDDRTTNNYYTRNYNHSDSSWSGWQSQNQQRDAYAANQQNQQAAQDRANDQRQRNEFLANQNNQLEIQAAQDRQDRDNAREAAAASERARGEADELAQARQAEAATAREDAEQQARIKQGEDDENRQAREANSDTADSGAAAEEAPQ